MNRSQFTRAGLTLAVAAAVGSWAPSDAEAQNGSRIVERGTVGTLEIAKQGVLFVGGEYTDSVGADRVYGQAFVHYQIPAKIRQRAYPIIMIHGSGQTGANFLGTPDDRSGWADYFVKRGWPVYVVDQPGRGKSGYNPGVYQPQALPGTVNTVQDRFTAVELNPTWPQASLHTQWPGGPGSGVKGRPAFDQFMASQVPNMPSTDQQHDLTTRAIAELIDKIGPAIIVTHSMSGPQSWLIPQAVGRAKIKAVIAVEPSGPTTTATGGPSLAWGIAATPVTYSPRVTDPAQLGLTRAAPESPDRYGCFLQSEPAHKLPWLAGIPIAVITGEASYHAPYDYCMSRYLTQAGVQNDYVYLPEVGIHGNGHMMMLELNNLEIASFMEGWLTEHLKGGKK